MNVKPNDATSTVEDDEEDKSAEPPGKVTNPAGNRTRPPPSSRRHLFRPVKVKFEETVEKTLSGPIFVIDYPAAVCPLTKRKSDAPEIAERFELYVAGMELANAYTELNDPDLQEELFRTQLAGLSDDESMARMDHDFIKSLRHGMPPAGGLGIGIDRLVMFLTQASSIRDVILFPIHRPHTGS